MDCSLWRNDCLPDALADSLRDALERIDSTASLLAIQRFKWLLNARPTASPGVLSIACKRSAAGLKPYAWTAVVSTQWIWPLSLLTSIGPIMRLAVPQPSAHVQGHGSLMRMDRVRQSLLAAAPTSLKAGCWSWSLNSAERPAERNPPQSPSGLVDPAERPGSTRVV